MVQWFKKHSNFLRSESKALSNNSNYVELFQLRDNLFISHGEIIVRLTKTYKFPILIVYPDSTPFSIPEVYPLKRVLTEKEVNEISKLSSPEVNKKIRGVIHFYYNLRHQNNSGNLCILELDNVDDGSKYFGISSILKRVRDWYAGHFTGNFPLDNEEVELFSHFTSVNDEINLIYTEEYLNASVVEGDCYAALTSIVPQSNFFRQQRYIYSGFLLEGFSKAGLLLNTNKELKYKLHDKLKQSADLHIEKEIVKKLINEKTILKACWFHSDIEPTPFENLKELVTIIGTGDFEAGVNRMERTCNTYLTGDPESFFVGLRFISRRGIAEFTLFKVLKLKKPPVIDLNPKKRFRSILARYSKIEAIECEKVTEATFHQRNSKRADYDILKNKTVNVLGVGAIGSEISDCLAKAGLGSIILVDNQYLKANNAVRHLAGFDLVGQAKSNSVATIISNHNPFISVIPIVASLTHLNANMNLTIDSISISSVADDNVEGYLNEQFVISNHTCFYVRALRGGKMARIFRVIPGRDACFQCLNLHRQDQKEFIDIPQDPNYLTLKNECNNPIRPASASDLKLIASLASRIFTDFLQGSLSDVNHWIWSTETIDEIPAIQAYNVHTQKLSIHPKCFYCNNEREHKILISKKNVEFMRNLVKENPTVETGGILAGVRDSEGNFEITDVSGPGPKATKKGTKFEKDIEYCQNFLDKLYVDSNKKILYLGEWHSHPALDNRLSGQDIESLSGIAEQKEYLTIDPVSIILSNEGQLSCTVHPAGKRFYYAELTIN